MPRPISHFALTIPRFEHHDVLEQALVHEMLCTTYVISTEPHEEPTTLDQSSFHLHAYFLLDPESTCTQIDNVRQRLHSAFQALAGEEAPSGFDIQPAKRPEKWLCYITKVSIPKPTLT